jgi:hypothetical protein
MKQVIHRAPVEKSHRHARDDTEPAHHAPFRRQEPSQQDIERRAYELYKRRDGADGSPLVDWLEAERELRASATGRAIEREEDI